MSPQRLAQQVTEVEAVIRDTSLSPNVHAAAGELHQFIYRRLGRYPRVRAETLALLGQRDRTIAQSLSVAGSRLLRLNSSHKAFPTWTVVPPEPYPDLLSYYHDAEGRTGVKWEVLAAIHLVATRMGRIEDRSGAGPRGPMQITPAVWKRFGKGDIDSNKDSILAAARFLKGNGAPRQMGKALRAYFDSKDWSTAISLLARILEAEPREFHALYFWQVLYIRDNELFLIPEGYPAARPTLAPRAGGR